MPSPPLYNASGRGCCCCCRSLTSQYRNPGLPRAGATLLKNEAVRLRARIKSGREAFVTGDLARKPESFPGGIADVTAAYMTPGGYAYFQTQTYVLHRGEKGGGKKPKDKTTAVIFPGSIWDLPVSTDAARSYAVPLNFEFEVMGKVDAKE